MPCATFESLRMSGVVDVRQLNERHAAREPEYALDEVHQRVGKEQQETAEGEVAVAREVGGGEVDALREVVGHLNNDAAEGCQHGNAQNLCALRQLLYAVDGYQPHEEFNDDELVRNAQAKGAEHQLQDERHRGRARIEEDAHEQGHHGVGNDIDAKVVVAHHKVRQHGERHDAYEDEQELMDRVHIVAAEHAQVEGEDAHRQEDEEGLARYLSPAVGAGALLRCVLAQEAVEDLLVAGRDDVASVDDALARQHHAVRRRNVAHQLLARRGRFRFVGGEVGRQVMVKVKKRHDVAPIVQRVGRHHVFVGRTRGAQFVEAHRRGLLLADNAHALDAIRAKRIVLLGAPDHLAPFSFFSHVLHLRIISCFDYSILSGFFQALLMVLRALVDLEAPVDLLDEHDAGQVVREGHLGHAEPSVRPRLHRGRKAIRAADDEA